LQENTLQRLSRQQDPLNTLKWFVRQVIEFVDRNYELLIEASETGDIPTLSFPAHLWWRQTIQGLLSRIDRNVDVDYLSDVLYVMLDVNTFSFQRHTLNYDVDRIISGLIDLVDRLLTQ